MMTGHMLNQNNKIMVDSIKRLLRRGATTNLRKIVDKTHAADLSIVFRSLSVANQLQLLHMIRDTEKKGILFSELDEDTFSTLSNELALEDIVEVLEQMPSDDVADLMRDRAACDFARPADDHWRGDTAFVTPCLELPERLSRRHPYRNC